MTKVYEASQEEETHPMQGLQITHVQPVLPRSGEGLLKSEMRQGCPHRLVFFKECFLS